MGCFSEPLRDHGSILVIVLLEFFDLGRRFRLNFWDDLLLFIVELSWFVNRRCRAHIERVVVAAETALSGDLVDSEFLTLETPAELDVGAHLFTT